MDGGQQKGPISEDVLKSLASSGRIGPDTSIWSKGLAEWSPACTLDNITWPATSPPPPQPRDQTADYRSPANTGQQIPNYLPWSIAATLLCCIPGGIIAIVYSSKATNAQNIGNYDVAKKAANNAKLWLIISVVSGLIVLLSTFMTGLQVGG